MNIILALVIWTLQLIFQLVGIILGYIIIPIAIIFPNDSAKAATYKSKNSEQWWLRRLPNLFKWWDNKVDGTLGDDEFRWASRDIPFGLKNTSFFGQYWWMAVRNPFNYFKRFILGCDVRKSKIEKLFGQDYVRDDFDSTGCQFLKCGKFYAFYWVYRYGKSNRALVIQLGNKFDLEDNSKTYPEDQEYKYYKGFTFEINPFKDIS